MTDPNMILNGVYRQKEDGSWVAEGGITIREAFAMAAMQGFLANPEYHEDGFSDSARSAVKQADALIAELNKEKKP